MSVASVNNGQLQLSELVISNEKYSAASGYVASQSTFTSSNTSTSLNSNTISAVSQVISPSFQLSLGGSTTSKPALSTNSANNCVISTITGAGLTLSNPNGSVSLTAPSANTLAVPNLNVTGSVSAATYAGGIANYFDNYAFSIAAGTSTSANFTIPNFIGTAESSYVISPNGTGAEVAYSLLWNIAYAGPSGTTGTLITISVFNFGATTVTADIDFSVIAMN